MSKKAKPVNKKKKTFAEAVRMITLHRNASASFLQRTLDIKYETACELIEAMESRGLIGPANGSKPRKILVGPDYSFIKSNFSEKTLASVDKMILPKLIECLNNTIESKLHFIKSIYEELSPMGLDPRAIERIALYAHLLGLRSGATVYVEEYKKYLEQRK